MWQRIAFAAVGLLLLGTLALTFVSRGIPVAAAQAQAPAAKHFLEEGKNYWFSSTAQEFYPGKVLQVPKDNWVKVEAVGRSTRWINLNNVVLVELIPPPVQKQP